MAAVFPFSQSVLNIIAAGNFTPVFACELDFADGIVRAHTGTGPLVINGYTYDGVGWFGDVGSASESTDSGSSLSVDLTLNGLDSYILSQTSVAGCRGRAARLIFVVYDQAGNYAADVLFSGRMDAARLSYGGSNGDSSITVTIIDRMAEWNRAGTERWTDENHRARNGGDRFFYAVAQMAEWPIYWGAVKDAPSFTYE
ncbi:hypothetical protein [Pseudomonas sp.]|uniref:hypothetical protein n=1 Tax=Pseudomonas sp. TaxID=306 RepID=UPI0028B17F24|nr:hypothetical protein [Pseudomonas sp.]